MNPDVLVMVLIMSSDVEKMIDRQMLYEEVWNEPVSVVALRYGLSDVGLAKICRSLVIPLPSRGYWAKISSGREMKRVPLSPLAEGRAMPSLKKSTSDQISEHIEAKNEVKKIRQEITTKVVLSDEIAELHPLVKMASKRLRQRDAWPTDTNLRCASGEVLNLSVTPVSLDRALHIVDALLKAFEANSITAHIDSNKEITLLRDENLKIEMSFSLIEQVKRTLHEETPSEKKALQRYRDSFRFGRQAEYPHIPKYDYQATGLFTIQIGHWPSRKWNDTPKSTLETRLGEVVADTLVLAKETHAKAIEDARREDERQRAKQHYEFLVARREEEISRLKNLELQAENWKRAEFLREYAAAVEQRSLLNGVLDREAVEWLLWARAKADSLDPLVPVSDPILDAPEPQRRGFW
ncbi:hypothetical protein H8K33_17720 [Undibacterium amnicola]|uniref:Uncharacterized protein n=1 Tax=Undibacterium amnicola TaxID=1834038 RepID=A0ABR6XV47_9BURK|nr:hypothetical protein [Undibacterium amnicola]MBC3833354.1 hypothetical protein [Undibacterium amnicola]